MSRSRQRGRWWWWVAPVIVLAAWLFVRSTQPQPEAVVLAASIAAAGTASGAAASAVSSGASGPAPFSASGLQARQAELAAWQQRLERAQATLETYRQATRYPHESRPIAEQPDQVYPNQPIAEDHPFRMPRGQPAPGVRLRTTQERAFVQGRESVRFTLSVVDEKNQTQPLRVLRASAREVTAPGAASLYPVINPNFNDNGTDGDLTAGDGVHSVQLTPATQGFANLFGQIRVEVFLEHRQQQGFTFFDIMVSPDAPATWAGNVRDVVEGGSMVFVLPVDVRESGRYVVTGRVDDAQGKPFALLTFNEEVAAGSQAFRLTLFGKLIRDGEPAFPLRLRDVEGFLLRPDSFPDRSLMPRRAGTVHVSREVAHATFSDAEWSSEERSRYLAELGRDVREARDRVDQLDRPR